MTQSAPRSSPVPRLLFLSLLLLFLLVPAQSWALHLEIMQPYFNNDVFDGTIGWTLSVVKDSPSEQFLNLAKVTVSIDGGAEQIIYDSSTLPQAMVQFASWVYDGTQDGPYSEHDFAFRAWVWQSTMGPPLFIPQWSKVPLNPNPDPVSSHETVRNVMPSLTLHVAAGDSPNELRLGGRAYSGANGASLSLQVNGQAVMIGQDGKYNTSIQLIPGHNVVVAVLTDTHTNVSVSRQVEEDYYPYP